MTINRLHDEIERGIEAMWARQQDVAAIDALRKKMSAEAELAVNLATVQAKQGEA